MKIAIISDIHGNLPALEAVLSTISNLSCDEIICLGDIVGYGARPNECIQKLRDLRTPCILGNHDAAAIEKLSLDYMNRHARAAIEWTSSVLTTESRRFLEEAPISLQNSEAYFVHSSPDDPWEWRYIFNQSEAKSAFTAFSELICFIGHTHFPIVYADPESGRRLINVGSVGQPRDRDCRSCFGIYDSISGAFRWERVEYSVEVAAKQIRDAGLPVFLAERLTAGI